MFNVQCGIDEFNLIFKLLNWFKLFLKELQSKGNFCSIYLLNFDETTFDFRRKILKKNLKQRILKGKINFKVKLVNGETSSQFIIQFKMLFKLTLKQQPNWKKTVGWVKLIYVQVPPQQKHSCVEPIQSLKSYFHLGIIAYMNNC